MNYKNIEQGDLLQENDEIFGYGKLSIPSDKKWAKIPNWLVGKILPFGISVLRRPIQETIPVQEPLEYRQHYIALEEHDLIQHNDEVFDDKTGKWNAVTEIAGNTPHNWPLLTFRRKVPTYSPAMA
jgi:hypothetical protein